MAMSKIHSADVSPISPMGPCVVVKPRDAFSYCISAISAILAYQVPAICSGGEGWFRDIVNHQPIVFSMQ